MNDEHKFGIMPVIDQGYHSYIYIDRSLFDAESPWGCNESIAVFDWNDAHKT